LAQWWTARSKFKLDLFDRRWSIYMAARDMIGEISVHGRASMEAQHNFLVGIRGARWLFNDQVASYLEQKLWHRMSHLDTANAIIDAPSHPDRQHHIDKKTEIMTWIAAQYQEMDTVFGEFFKVDQNILEWLRGRQRRV
jgi:hypothetical protein